MDVCKDYKEKYPKSKKYNRDTIKYTIQKDGESVTFSHWDDDELSDLDFYHREHIIIREKTDIGNLKQN